MYFETDSLAFTRIEKRVDDEFSESFESFSVASYGFFGSPLHCDVGVVGIGLNAATKAMGFHLNARETEREAELRKKEAL